MTNINLLFASHDYSSQEQPTSETNRAQRKSVCIGITPPIARHKKIKAIWRLATFCFEHARNHRPCWQQYMKRGGQSTLVTPFSYHILSSKLTIRIDSFPLPKIKKTFLAAQFFWLCTLKACRCAHIVNPDFESWGFEAWISEASYSHILLRHQALPQCGWAGCTSPYGRYGS